MGKKKKKRAGYDPDWAQAKKVCRLNQDDIRKAKELGLKPKTLLKNNPSPQQQWKLPVKQWIRELYQKRFGKTHAELDEEQAQYKHRRQDLIEEFEMLRNEFGEIVLPVERAVLFDVPDFEVTDEQQSRKSEPCNSDEIPF